MSALSEKALGGFHQSFRERRMGMYAQFEVGSDCPHFDGEHTLRDQFSGAGAGEPHSEDAFGFGINYQFSHAVAAVESGGPARSSPGEAGDLHWPAFFFGLGFGQP